MTAPKPPEARCVNCGKLEAEHRRMSDHSGAPYCDESDRVTPPAASGGTPSPEEEAKGLCFVAETVFWLNGEYRASHPDGLCDSCAHIASALRSREEMARREANLGLATTGQLLDEIRARIEVHWDLNYRTVDPQPALLGSTEGEGK